MVMLTMDEIRALMEKKWNICNMSVISHVSHGKSTLTDCLVAAAGITPVDQAGQQFSWQLQVDNSCFQSSKEERTHCCHRSPGIPRLYHQLDEERVDAFKDERDGNGFLINLTDYPGIPEYSSEATAALRITDRALLVVDCMEGLCVYTETALRQALAERIVPVVTINKMDRCFLELTLEGEEAYSKCLGVIENINAILATYQDDSMGGDLRVYPNKGTVSFSSGRHGWAFTLTTFAKLYAAKFGTNESRMMEKLWGDNFFDPATKKWTKRQTDSSKTCVRGFVQFCYNPIKQLIDNCMQNKKPEVFTMLEKLNVLQNLESWIRETEGMIFMKEVMKTFLPAGQALLEMIVLHLPSAARAQKYRVDTLYEGPLDDAYATAIRNCDSGGPLMMYVSKMMHSSERAQFVAFGRVFAGRIGSGTQCRIMGATFVVGQQKDLYNTAVQRAVLYLRGNVQEALEDVPCGNTVALFGLDQYISRTATITNEENINAHPMRALKFSVSAVVRVAVEPEKAADLPKLIAGLRRLARCYSDVECNIEETGAHIISGTSELHLEECLKGLRHFLSLGLVAKRDKDGPKIHVSEPMVLFRETVAEASDHIVMSKSPNNHNRFYLRARPMEHGLAEDIDQGKVPPWGHPDRRFKHLSEKYGWDNEITKKIWAFGPDTTGPNMLIDVTKGVPCLNEIQDSCVGALQWATKKGVLAEEDMRGVVYEVHDVVMHPDAIHRGGGQLIPTCRRALYAAELTAKPRLMEPVYLVEIKAPRQVLGDIYSMLHQKRGMVVEETWHPDTLRYNIKAHLPILESFGFTLNLRDVTAGQAYSEPWWWVFDHWETMNMDPLQPGNQAANLVADIRHLKGLQPGPRPLAEYEDQL